MYLFKICNQKKLWNKHNLIDMVSVVNPRSQERKTKKSDGYQ